MDFQLFLQKASLEGADEESLAVEGAVADDVDAEFISNIVENSILGPDSLTGKLVYILYDIIQNPSKCTSEPIMIAAVQAFAKILCVSQSYAEEKIPLFFTILERSESEKVRQTIIITTPDLFKRFPNTLEPWTPRLYDRFVNCYSPKFR